MTRAHPDVETGVKAIIAELLGAWACGGNLPSEATLGDHLGMKALDRAELALEIEDDFQITVFTKQFSELRTVGDVIAYVEERLASPLRRVGAAA